MEMTSHSVLSIPGEGSASLQDKAGTVSRSSDLENLPSPRVLGCSEQPGLTPGTVLCTAHMLTQALSRQDSLSAAMAVWVLIISFLLFA